MPHPPADPLLVAVDVTDTLASGWRAGIQRVVVQLVDNLRTVDERIELLPLVWSPALAGHRRLLPSELEDLMSPGVRSARGSATGPAAGAEPPLPARLVRDARRALRLLGRVGAHTLAFLRLKQPVKEVLRRISLRTTHRWEVPLAVPELPRGSVLFDLDTVWNQTRVDRDALYRRLRAGGVHVAALVYDLLPLEHPEWFERSLVEVFDEALTAQARHAELLLAISGSTARSLNDWVTGRGIDAPDPLVVGLGADAVPDREARGPGTRTPLPREVVDGRYVLVVGTVEPRKNHTVLLDAFEDLAAAVPDVQLVVVGRPGWENDRVVRRLERHPLSGSRLHWFRDAPDDLLATLYDHALVVAVPSATEGFGLPVIEAFRHGVPVVASDGGALPEAGGDLAEYVAPHDVAGWTAALRRHCEDASHDAACRAALEGYRPRSWNDSAREVAAALVAAFAPV